jgi:hypothetical protein
VSTMRCGHTYQPEWRVDPDGIGRLCCHRCGDPLTPAPTGEPSAFEVFAVLVLLLFAVIGAAVWAWWLWIG